MLGMKKEDIAAGQSFAIKVQLFCMSCVAHRSVLTNLASCLDHKQDVASGGKEIGEYLGGAKYFGKSQSQSIRVNFALGLPNANQRLSRF